MKDERNGEFIWLFEMLKIILYYYYIILSLFGRQQINFVAKHEKKNTTSYIISLKKIIINKNLDWFHLIVVY